MRADWIRLMIAAARLPLHQRPGKQPIGATKCPRLDLIVDLVVVDRTVPSSR